MKSIKEYIIEAAKNDIVMSPEVLSKFFLRSRFDDAQLWDMLDSWYKEYAYVMVSRCKSSTISVPFDLRVVYSKKEGVIFKGVNKKTVLEFLHQLDTVFDKMQFNQNFRHWGAKLTEDGLMLMFRNNALSSEVKSFCDKNYL